ncbi:MAG: NifB/NifX family molybdenum-iron cluster-binding protein [Anaerolineales bacterium]|nr:NifB/NifX family molybdenum-iron cluster-binding protein [Anaerolineales bacterium]
MKIVVTSEGANLDAPASPVFGRCPTYIFVDTETMGFEVVSNPAMSAAGGAGIQAAQFVVEQGAQAVLTGNVGPNAYNVFQAANVPIYLLAGGTVREAVEAYKAGQLQSVTGANVQAHAGMGMGRGMGRGMGMGRGIGMGQGAYGPGAWGTTAPPALQPAPPASREEEVAALKQAAGDLRQQLAEVMERLDKLEKGG